MMLIKPGMKLKKTFSPLKARWRNSLDIIGYQNIDLKPKIKFEEKIKDYFIEGSKLYILVENEKENAQLLQVYDLNTGKKLNRIKLKWFQKNY